MKLSLRNISNILFLLFIGCGGTGTVEPAGFEVYDIAVAPSQTSAVISYKTSLPAKTTLDYGLSGGALSNTVTDTVSFTSTHSITLNYLTTVTNYDYSITAWTEAGETFDTDILTFTTLPKTQNEPIISGLTISNITATSAVINWFTDEASTSVVLYGITAAYGDSVTSGSLVYQHQMTVSGLQEQTQYFFTAASDDIEGYRGFSQDSSFTTGQYIHLTLPDTTAAANSLFQYPVRLSGADDLGGLQYQVQYDTTYLTAVDVIKGPFTLDNHYDFFVNDIYNLYGYLENYITYQPIFQGDSLVGTYADGAGTIAYIDFLTKGVGLTTVSFIPDSSIFLNMYIEEIEGDFEDGLILIQ